MAKIIQDEEERNRRINMVGDLCLNTGYSYRELADYLTKHYFKISFVTVKNYLEKYIKMHPDKKEEINSIILENTITNFKNDEKIKNRIYKEAELIEAGYTIEKIASALLISQSVVSRDMSVRFSVMEPERYENIVKILSENSLNNLYNIKSEGESEKGRKR